MTVTDAKKSCSLLRGNMSEETTPLSHDIPIKLSSFAILKVLDDVHQKALSRRDKWLGQKLQPGQLRRIRMGKH